MKKEMEGGVDRWKEEMHFGEAVGIAAKKHSQIIHTARLSLCVMYMYVVALCVRERKCICMFHKA